MQVTTILTFRFYIHAIILCKKCIHQSIFVPICKFFDFLQVLHQIFDRVNIRFIRLDNPFRQSRINAKKKLGYGFYEIYIHADIKILHSRDTKGLYKLARKGLIVNLIGVSERSKYETPKNPDLKITPVIKYEVS